MGNKWRIPLKSTVKEDYVHIERPQLQRDNTGRQSFYSPYAPLNMLNGAGITVHHSMSTTQAANYIPEQTIQMLDGFGAGVGAFNMGNLVPLSEPRQNGGFK